MGGINSPGACLLPLSISLGCLQEVAVVAKLVEASVNTVLNLCCVPAAQSLLFLATQYFSTFPLMKSSYCLFYVFLFNVVQRLFM